MSSVLQKLKELSGYTFLNSTQEQWKRNFWGVVSFRFQVETKKGAEKFIFQHQTKINSFYMINLFNN